MIVVTKSGLRRSIFFASFQWEPQRENFPFGASLKRRVSRTKAYADTRTDDTAKAADPRKPSAEAPVVAFLPLVAALPLGLQAGRQRTSDLPCGCGQCSFLLPGARAFPMTPQATAPVHGPHRLGKGLSRGNVSSVQKGRATGSRRRADRLVPCGHRALAARRRRHRGQAHARRRREPRAAAAHCC